MSKSIILAVFLGGAIAGYALPEKISIAAEETDKVSQAIIRVDGTYCSGDCGETPCCLIPD